MAKTPDTRLDNDVTKPALDAQHKRDRKKPDNRAPIEDYKANRNPTPYLNRVYTFPDGTELHYDSTPGFSCYEFRHSSGHVYQIADDGMETRLSVGNVHDYKKEGYTLTVDQNGDVTIKGHMRLSVEGGAHVEVKGDLNVTTTGDMNMYVGGNFNKVVAGNYNLAVNGNRNTTIGKNNKLNVRANHEATIDSNSTTKIGASSSEESSYMVKKADKIDLNP